MKFNILLAACCILLAGCLAEEEEENWWGDAPDFSACINDLWEDSGVTEMEDCSLIEGEEPICAANKVGTLQIFQNECELFQANCRILLTRLAITWSRALDTEFVNQDDGDVILEAVDMSLCTTKKQENQEVRAPVDMCQCPCQCTK